VNTVMNHSNEPSGSIECWEILERLSDWRLLKKGSAAWSEAVTDVCHTCSDPCRNLSYHHVHMNTPFTTLHAYIIYAIIIRPGYVPREILYKYESKL
jgi:hypothetical protein